MLFLQQMGRNDLKLQIGVDAMKKLAYGIKEAAVSLDVSKTHLHRMVNEGVIRSVQLGKRKLIPADELESFIANRNQTGVVTEEVVSANE
jgi:excisionase family DNA binding protein